MWNYPLNGLVVTHRMDTSGFDLSDGLWVNELTVQERKKFGVFGVELNRVFGDVGHSATQ